MKLFRNASRAIEERDFESSWVALMEWLKSDTVKASDGCLAYVETLYQCRELWAWCFRIGVFTGGMVSSQRIESTFAALKGVLVTNGTLQELKSAFDVLLGRREVTALTAADASLQSISVTASHLTGNERGPLAALHSQFRRSHLDLLREGEQHGSTYCARMTSAAVDGALFFTVRFFGMVDTLDTTSGPTKGE
jgi:hypothetical protein